MKLGDWLKRNNMSRAEFARRTGLSKGSISQFCNEESAWVSRETAEQIFRETGGAVTPNDFLKICEIKGSRP
jgi:3,4-dihydroxy 2-butanone 4-phosphate synthase/GTP cyclohydrolase II